VSRTISDAITEARVFLQDTATPYRYSDDQLLAYLNNSFASIRNIRPDIFVGSFTSDPPSYSTVDSTAYPLADQYFPATVYYITSEAEARNDQATANGRAAYFKGLFAAEMRGG
jgi:hypothetical protein